jgi:hypothetical protein
MARIGVNHDRINKIIINEKTTSKTLLTNTLKESSRGISLKDITGR